MRKNFKHLCLEDRIAIKDHLKRGDSIRKVAESLGLSKSGIYAELKRSSGTLDVDNYDPYLSDSLAKDRSSRKGRRSMFEADSDLTNRIAHMLLHEKMTVPSVAKYIAQNPEFKCPSLSHTTIYNAIRNGLIPGVTMETLNNQETRMFSDRLIYIPKWACEKFDFNEGDLFSIRFSETGTITIQKKTDA